MRFCTSLSKQVFRLVGFVYVDDCDLVQSGTTSIEVLDSIKIIINGWGALMDVTGGLLSVDKSWWFLIECMWNQGKWIANDVDVGVDFVAKDSAGEIVSLKILQANEASKMLGVWIAHDGNNTTIINKLKVADI